MNIRMKKVGLFVLVTVLLLALAGCGEAKVSSEQAAQIASDRATVVEGIPIKKHGVEYWRGLEGADLPGGIDQPIEHFVDWVWFRNAGELVDAAEGVFTGRVTGISFGVSDDDFKENILTTFYTIEVREAHKGALEGTVVIGMPGGIDACLEEQDAVRRAAGLRPVILANIELSVGETYLFCVHITEDGRVLHHTLLQFAFPDESDDAAVIRRVCAAEQ